MLKFRYVFNFFKKIIFILISHVIVTSCSTLKMLDIVFWDKILPHSWNCLTLLCLKSSKKIKSKISNGYFYYNRWNLTFPDLVRFSHHFCCGFSCFRTFAIWLPLCDILVTFLNKTWKVCKDKQLVFL